MNVKSTAPAGIWVLKKNVSDKHHTYIVSSTANRRTMVYVNEGGKLGLTNELKLDGEESTMNVTRFHDNSMVQVGMYKLKLFSKDGKVRDEIIRGRVLKATGVNEGRQLLLSLGGGCF